MGKNEAKLKLTSAVRWYRKYSQNTTNKGGVIFITKTTCFGPCTGPSSGLELCLNDTEETLPNAYRAWNHPISSYSYYPSTPLVHNHTHFTYRVLIPDIAYDLDYNTSFCWHLSMVMLRSVFTHGPPGRQIFRGGILKQSRLKYGMRKKRAVHERDLYWKQCWYRVFSLRRYWR